MTSSEADTIPYGTRLGVSESTIRRWRRADALFAIKVVGAWLIPADELDAPVQPRRRSR